ncbi:MAG: hypothetical protein AAF492_28750 [Verrucomicrobiota bacterium]
MVRFLSGWIALICLLGPFHLGLCMDDCSDEGASCCAVEDVVSVAPSCCAKEDVVPVAPSCCDGEQPVAWGMPQPEPEEPKNHGCCIVLDSDPELMVSKRSSDFDTIKLDATQTITLSAPLFPRPATPQPPPATWPPSASPPVPFFILFEVLRS